MTVRFAQMPEAETTTLMPRAPEDGFGALTTAHGNLPLELLDVQAKITGLIADVELTQRFVNPHDDPIEATYVFPLPDRGAVTRMRMEADDRVVEGVLEERSKARAAYSQAIAAGKRASIAEEERPDVFTMSVGNIVPGERVTIRLTIAQPLPYEDGAATFRFPLVVAPRYIPGSALDGDQVGDGYAQDTDAVPDASRITPPVLLPGFPNPVQLSIDVDIDPGGLPLGDVRCSLHEVNTEGSRITMRPGARADRDFILRLAYGEAETSATACVVHIDEPATDREPTADREPAADRVPATDQDADREPAADRVPATDQDADREPAAASGGTFRLTVLPPASSTAARPRDIVIVLDRSGSMAGWKIVAARRAAARIVDTLTDADRFAVLTFDNVVERPTWLPSGLVDATDRHRYRAVEHLARVEARGGTEMLTPLHEAVGLLTDAERDRVIVLVTDGQVGNEDQLLRELTPSMSGIRVHTIGIDRGVNSGFLTRLAGAGGGRCELVESEDRLDEAASKIHHRIAAPLLTGLRLSGAEIVPDTVAPARLPDLFPGVPAVISGRWSGSARVATAKVTVSGRTADGSDWSAEVPVTAVTNPALTAVWARAHLRDLEDRYVVGESIEDRIVATSLKFGVLCRFTAYVAVDSRVVTEGGTPRRVVQPVEPASGWDMLREPVPGFAVAAPGAMAASMMPMAHGPVQGAAPTVRLRAGGLSSVHDSAEGSLSGVVGGVTAEAHRFAKNAAARFRRGPDPLAAARVQVADEARRLREGISRTERERRMMLADLGSRLEALAVHLNVSGHALEAAPLHELALALRNCDLPQPLGSANLGQGSASLEQGSATLERLWRRTLDVLDAFAAGHGPDVGSASVGWRPPGPGVPSSPDPGGASSSHLGGSSPHPGGSSPDPGPGGARRRGGAFWKRS
jgi:Ca-activated chloride channel family protein